MGKGEVTKIHGVHLHYWQTGLPTITSSHNSLGTAGLKHPPPQMMASVNYIPYSAVSSVFALEHFVMQ